MPTITKLKTYALLDLWASAPPEEGWGRVMYMLRLNGYKESRKEVKHEVWLRLCRVGLLAPDRDPTHREWKQAKVTWQRDYSGSLTE